MGNALLCPWLKENGVPVAQAATYFEGTDSSSLSLEKRNWIRELCWDHCPYLVCFEDIKRRGGRPKNVVTK